MTLRWLIPALILAAPTVHAQIYRCQTPQGVVFSDERCGEQAEIVQFEDESSGVTIAPPEEVSEYLAQKRDEREEAREAYRDSLAAAPPPVAYPVPGREYYYPVYRRPVFHPPLYPWPPIHRPPPVHPVLPPRAPPSTLDPNR